jgi:chromosome segregation ATPase
MLIPFCNMCEEKCPAHTTRHFTDLGKLLGGHSAGLEVIPLTNGEVSTETHICDGCLNELMSKVVGKGEHTPAKKDISERESQLKAALLDVAKQQAQLNQNTMSLRAKEKDLAELNKGLSATIVERDKRIKVLETQLGTLPVKDERIKELEAQIASTQEQSAKVWKHVTAQATVRAVRAGGIR